MDWISQRRRNAPVHPEQRWDCIQLHHFQPEGGRPYLSYGLLHVGVAISLCVYIVDIFTAINLLVFDRWSSDIQPAIPFHIAKWIFSVCILLSFMNLAYEYRRAQLIIQRGVIAEAFLDNLCYRLQSILRGENNGWQKFLVFTELGNTKEKAEYLTFFAHSRFQVWIRVVFCSGPRQLVNAATLSSVYNAKLQVHGDSFKSIWDSAWHQIGALAEEDLHQALIFFSMFFTLVIWVLKVVLLMLASLLFTFFLWAWIPKGAGGLSGYCSKIVNKRLTKIVTAKAEKSAAPRERQRGNDRDEAAEADGAAPGPSDEREYISPWSKPGDDKKLPTISILTRNNSEITLPAYSSTPATPQLSFEMTNIPPSYSQRATTPTTPGREPLLASAAEMG